MLPGESSSRGARMSSDKDGDTCYFCHKGKFVTRKEGIQFHQWTDKGYIFCRVNVSIGVCDQCGSRDWSEEADTVIEEAIRREYNKLT